KGLPTAATDASDDLIVARLDTRHISRSGGRSLVLLQSHHGSIQWSPQRGKGSRHPWPATHSREPIRSWGLDRSRRTHGMQDTVEGIETPQLALRLAFGLVPVLAGLDKFTYLLADWSKYVSPVARAVLPVAPTTFLYVAGVIEIVVGLAIL